jgi:heme exporter protein CcmD
MNDMIMLFSMGDYGAYVWSSYGLVGAALILGIWYTKRHSLRTRQALRDWFYRQDI